MLTPSYRLRTAVYLLASDYPASDDGSPTYVLKKTFAVVIHNVNTSTFSGENFSVVLRNSSDFQGFQRDNLILGSSRYATAAIRIPATQFSGYSTDSGARIVYSCFVNGRLFLRRRGYISQHGLMYDSLGSIVLGVHFADMQTVADTGLEQPVWLNFVKNPVRTII